MIGSVSAVPAFADVLAAQAGRALTWQDRSQQRGSAMALRRRTTASGLFGSTTDFSVQWRVLLLQQRVRQAGLVAYHGSLAEGLTALHNGLSTDAVRQDPRLVLDEGIEVFMQIAGELEQLNRSLGHGGPAPAMLARRDLLLLEVGHWVGGDLGLNAAGQAQLSVDGQDLIEVAGPAALLYGEGLGRLDAARLASRFIRRGAFSSGPPVCVLRGKIGALLALAAALPQWLQASANSSTAQHDTMGLKDGDALFSLACEHRLAYQAAAAVQACLDDDWHSSVGLQLDEGMAQLRPFQRAYGGATALMSDGASVIGGLLGVLNQPGDRAWQVEAAGHCA